MSQQVVVPILIGLAAGVIFGLVVMGFVKAFCAIGRCVRRRRAGGKKAGCTVRGRKKCRFARFGKACEDGDCEENMGLVEGDGLKEAPPAYTDGEVEEGRMECIEEDDEEEEEREE